MANKSVLELAVQTGQWDAGLKKAKTALQNFTDASGGLQKALTEDSASMQKFVQMMGRTDSQAKTAKGQLNDYKSTIEQLTMQYNQMNDAQKQSIGQDYLRSIDQLKQKYQAVNQQIQEMNRSLAETPDVKPASGGGGLFGGGKLDGMLQVFGGNVMTKIAGMGAGLVTELGDAVKQGIELAKQGEGIRIAFERLGRGDILQGLREATHGTVTDLELMKAAVKFNDFKLPLDELGTMLAFAQQKAKDTGQSVDYMVDSIVTGLGRKSLMILDNLGLSAAQIKERMAETGDMTKAVGAIIRDEMAKAGDYVETAADRATQANVNLQNKMEELGRKFAPIEEASTHLWTSIKIGILDIVGGPLADLLNGLTRAGQLRNELKNIGSDERVNSDISKLKGSNFKEQVYTAMLNKYSREEQKALDNYKKAQKGGMGSIAIWENRYLAQKTMREDFQSRGREVLNGGNSRNTPTTPTNTITTTGTTSPVPVKIEGFDPTKAVSAGVRGVDTMPSVFDTIKDNSQVYGENLAAAINAAMGSISSEIDAAIAEQEKRIDELRTKWATAKDTTPEQRDSYMAQIIEGENNLRNLREMQSISSTTTPQQWDAKQDISKQWRVGKDGQLTNKPNGKEEKQEKTAEEQLQGTQTMIASLQSIVTGVESLGIQLPKELTNIFGVLQTITGIVGAIQTMQTVGTFLGIFHNGGIVPHAANGYYVPGNSYSGDTTPILANAGELILNKSSQSTLAAQLQNRDSQQHAGAPYITGEMIFLGLNNYLKSTGRGEMMTSRFKG